MFEELITESFMFLPWLCLMRQYSGNLLLCSDTSTATPSLCGALLAVFGRDPLWTVIALVVVVVSCSPVVVVNI